ncbi:hypothetical protein [Thermotoga sp.]|uniref:hypothetical protein n=1 Tax=Thermotoga sp. TaxID=28240 RepID=UPI0025E3AE02|nr:hypothetical protein [Thermotoga sp.]
MRIYGWNKHYEYLRQGKIDDPIKKSTQYTRLRLVLYAVLFSKTTDQVIEKCPSAKTVATKSKQTQ